MTSSSDLMPDFAKCGGLIPVIAQDDATGDVLMLAYMNAETFEESRRTGYATYYSRSRNARWRKGETSGHLQKIRAMALDCDNDTLLIRVEQIGGIACHTGARSCFFKTVDFSPAPEN